METKVASPAAAEKPAAPPQATVLKPEEPPLASAALPTKDVVPQKSENLDHPMTTTPKGSLNRDIALAKIEDEKRTSFIKAWEDGEKSKIENKTQINLAEVLSWENTKKASIEAKLKKMEEEIERKKAEHGEKMKNKVALVHKEAEEKKSLVLCKRSEELLQVEEMGAKFRVSGQVPKKALLGCFG